MPEYQGLPELRADLTAEDPDERAQAYGAVLQEDLEVSTVLSNEPPKQTLVDAGIIPPEGGNDYEPAAEYRKEQVSLLKEIRDILRNAHGSTTEEKTTQKQGGS